jgi:putative endonuclease
MVNYFYLPFTTCLQILASKNPPPLPPPRGIGANLRGDRFFVIPAEAGIQEIKGRTMEKQPAVYILASERNGTLYIGVTSDLVKRVWEHRNALVAGFTKRYGVHRLVWYELHETMDSAIQREKRLKEWKRIWKMDLIEQTNPDWQDLYDGIV